MSTKAGHHPNACCDYHRYIEDGCCDCESGATRGEPLTTTEAQALVATYRDAERALEGYVNSFSSVDVLSRPGYRRLLTDRDNAREALVAALVGGGS